MQSIKEVVRLEDVASVCFVLGVHRSGTSAVARALPLCGYSLGEQLLPPKEGVNPKGFFEDTDVIRINDAALRARRMTWASINRFATSDWKTIAEDETFIQEARCLLRSRTSRLGNYAAKDPRLAITLPLWLKAAELEALPVKLIVVLRSPIEVAASLSQRDGLSTSRALLLWLENFCQVFSGSRFTPRHFIRYDRLLSDPERSLRQIASFLQPRQVIDWAVLTNYSNYFLDASLRHHIEVESEDSQQEPSSLQRICSELYSALCHNLDHEALTIQESPAVRAAWDKAIAYLDAGKELRSLIDSAEGETKLLQERFELGGYRSLEALIVQITIQATDEPAVIHTVPLYQNMTGMRWSHTLGLGADMRLQAVRLDPADDFIVIKDTSVRLLSSDGRVEQAAFASSNAAINCESCLYFATLDPIIFFGCDQFDASWSRIEISFLVLHTGENALAAALKLLRRQSAHFTPILVSSR